MEENGYNLIRGTIPTFLMEELRETTKIASVAGVSTEIRIWHVPNQARSVIVFSQRACENHRPRKTRQ
jgi:hypothetical protein